MHCTLALHLWTYYFGNCTQTEVKMLLKVVLLLGLIGIALADPFAQCKYSIGL